MVKTRTIITIHLEKYTNTFFYFTYRESFPFDQQFNILMRFIVDQTQTPNLKVGIQMTF